MVDEKPTDVNAPVTETTEDAVELEAEKLEEAPGGPKDSEGAADTTTEEAAGEVPEKSEEVKAPKKSERTKAPKKSERTKAPKKSERTKAPKKSEKTKAPKKAEEPEEVEVPEQLPATEEPPALEVAEEVKALPVVTEGGDEEKAKVPADEEAKGPEPAKVEGEAPTEEKADEAAKAPEGETVEEVPKEPERTFADELREEYGDIETAKLDILPDLERKRDRLNAMAEDHKFKRDRLNSVTKSLAEERDSYNSQVRELVQSANEHRKNRNTLNTQVKEAKALRDELNKKATELNEDVTRLKRERQGETGGPSPSRLRNERKALEFKAMTQALSADKEKELMTQIQRLNVIIDEQEQKMEENREIRTALMESRAAKEEAENQHRLVSDLARQAQTAHDSMIELYEKADDIRKRADDCQGRFVTNKQVADAEHKAHIDLIRKVHDYDKFISGLRRRERRVRKDRQEKAHKKVAEDMMDRFKKGEKLSTEDLLSLQTERY